MTSLPATLSPKKLGLVIDLHHRDAQVNPDLYGGEADTGRGAHGIEHVGDQFA